MSDRVAVTGATGFIGWHVCERLRDAGWTVVAIVRPDSPKPLPDGVERVEAHLDRAAPARGFQRVDTIVHAAGIVRARSVAEYAAVNVDGTRAVVEAARALDARVVHVSSLTAVGPAPAERPHGEADAPAPITDYGASKLAAETVLRGRAGLRWTIVRPAAVYGPRDRQFLPLFQAARRGIFLRLPNADVFSLTLVHVGDVARAIEMVCGSTTVDGETLFIGHPTPASLDDLLRTLALTFHRPCRPLPVPFALVRLGAWLGVGGLTAERLRELMSPGFVCSVERAERCLGFRAAIALTEGLRSTAAWYRANRWLA
jgi:nucleoside-diphosphate-sugar epimerase